MTVSSIDVADVESPAKHLHTDRRIISGTARESQFVSPAWSSDPSYATYTEVSAATSGSHLLTIMGNGSDYSRLLRYDIDLMGARPASDTALVIELHRLATAGDGGTDISSIPYDLADDPYGGVIRELPTSRGEESGQLARHRLNIPINYPNEAARRIEWTVLPGQKPILFGTSTDSGIAFKVLTGLTSCEVSIHVEWATTSYR